MRARLLNALSVVAGTGFSIGLLLSIAHFLSVQENAAPQMQEDDLETLAVAILPPPPPPKPDERPAVVEEVRDAIPLGFQEEPSASPVKIAPSLPTFDELLPISKMPTHVVSSIIGIETSFKPTIDVAFNSEHVFKTSEVDKLPFLISRPDPPSVPAHVLQNNKGLNVVVLFVVDVDGVVGNVHILQSSDNAEFDSIFATWIREWRFSPAIKKGKPVRCMFQQLVRARSAYRDPFSL